MPMSPESERLARSLAAVDDALCDEVEAEILRDEAAGKPTDPSRFRDDGPDPLGTGWAWAGEPSLAAQPLLLNPGSLSPKLDRAIPGRRWRRAGYVIGAATAAGLLVALGVFLAGGFRNRGPETYALSAEATTLRLLGTDQPQPTVVSPLAGFVAAVGITGGGDFYVWPSEGDLPGRPVPVRKGEPIRVGPLPSAVTRVVLVVTEQPATAPLLQGFGPVRGQPGWAADLETRVTATLRGLNFRNLAVGQADYPPR